MKHKTCIKLLFLAGLLLALAGTVKAQDPPPQDTVEAQAVVGTAFTYQGELSNTMGLVNGPCNFRFTLWDAVSGGTQIGAPEIYSNWKVTNGRFMMGLGNGNGSGFNSQGNPFTGEARWLQIAVQCSGDSDFTPLTPRQPLTPVPYALGLRPGAVISGTASDLLTLNNSDVFGAGLYVRLARDAVYVQEAGRTGVYVVSAGGDGVHVYEAGWDGVDATSTAALYYGGRFRNSAAGGAGLYAGGGDNAAADLVLGGDPLGGDDGRIYTDPALTSSDLVLFSNDEVHLHLDENNDEGGNFIVSNGADSAVFSVDESGNMVSSGTKSAVVATRDYGQRKLYALESPQNWFEDFGSAELVAGTATVAIEPIFAQAVNLSETYHVFLTPLGDCPLYVAEKTPVSFTVKAMGGQACSIAFDYRLVARRLGYEDVRLEPATTHPVKAGDS